MEIVPKEQVSRIVEAKKAGEFTIAINQLEKGAALRISPQEFKMRFDTSIPHYFLGKYNREQKTVSCMRFGDYYYVIKL
jgi:hypothetical protein